MSAHNDIGPTLEILVAAIAEELNILQDEIPPSVEGILFNALLDVWKKGNKAAHDKVTIPPKRSKTNPDFLSPSIPVQSSDDEVDPYEAITKVSRFFKKF